MSYLIGDYNLVDDRFDVSDAFDAEVERLTSKGGEFYPFGPDNILEWVETREGMVSDMAEVCRIAWEHMGEFAKLPGASEALGNLAHDLQRYWQARAIVHLNTPEPY
ncbi:hypothetical protein CCP4SC76_3980004 [Gammaproteobacteria bacterium]